MVMVDRFETGMPFGPAFKKTVGLLKNGVTNRDDDVILIIAGLTGSGKSNLGLHIYEELTPDAVIDQIALTRTDFARALKNASTAESFRYVQYDEGKLNRREWQSEWSKELLEIYHDIRGLNIFHIWCTAYPELLDPVFITERVKGFIFIYTKDIHRPRKFLYFTKKDLLIFLEKNEKITVRALKKYGRTYASLDSWFKEYKGQLKNAYLQKKSERMTERVKDFWEKWGNELTTSNQIARELGVDDKSITNWSRQLIQEKALQQGEHFVINGAGKTFFTQAGVLILRNYSEEKMKKNALVSVGGVRPAFRAFGGAE